MFGVRNDHRDEGGTMKTVKVYQVDYVRKTKRPIGIVEERRNSDRPGNGTGLLHRARRKFAASADEAFRTIVNPA
jgi:hypothetical protein